MKLTQLLAYSMKPLTKFGAGHALNRAGKYAAGLYFDTFARTYRTEGMEFTIPVAHTTREMRGKFAFDTYELPERTLAKRHLPENARVLELGACIGVVSCLINSLLSDKSDHAAVEANPLLIPTLEANKATNNAGFRPINAVLTRRANASVSTDKKMDSNTVGTTGTPIPTTTVEDLEAESGKPFTALVMDIEGGEHEFCLDNTDLLGRIDVAIIEFHPHLLGTGKTADIYDTLQSAGLRRIDQMQTVECWARSQ